MKQRGLAGAAVGGQQPRRPGSFSVDVRTAADTAPPSGLSHSLSLARRAETSSWPKEGRTESLGNVLPYRSHLQLTGCSPWAAEGTGGTRCWPGEAALYPELTPGPAFEHSLPRFQDT